MKIKTDSTASSTSSDSENEREPLSYKTGDLMPVRGDEFSTKQFNLAYASQQERRDHSRDVVKKYHQGWEMLGGHVAHGDQRIRQSLAKRQTLDEEIVQESMESLRDELADITATRRFLRDQRRAIMRLPDRERHARLPELDVVSVQEFAELKTSSEHASFVLLGRIDVNTKVIKAEVESVKEAALAFLEVMTRALQALKEGLDAIDGALAQSERAEMEAIESLMSNQERFFAMHKEAVRLQQEGGQKRHEEKMEEGKRRGEQAIKISQEQRLKHQVDIDADLKRLEMVNDFEIKKLEKELERHRDDEAARLEMVKASRRKWFWFHPW